MRSRNRPVPLISLLVPYNGGDATRVVDWRWLRAYWESQLPGCEIVIGRDRRSEPGRGRRKPRPYSKTSAFNDAFEHSRGQVLVLIDADAYLPATVVTHCAERIQAAQRAGVRLWFVPYSYLYRLTRQATSALLLSNPRRPYGVPQPPPPGWVESTHGSEHGHKFGALCQIMPREAFRHLGGCDPRFVGWGGEDRSLLMALDTLWAPHTKTPNDILHFWHNKDVRGYSGSTEMRAWANEDEPRHKNYLAELYSQANGNRDRMRWLVDSGHDCECRTLKGA